MTPRPPDLLALADRRPRAHRAGDRGLAYLRFAPDADPVSVPEGRQGRRPDPRALRLRDRGRQLRRRLRHARRAGEPRRPAVAADRAAGHPHPRPLGRPGGADLPPRGRPRQDEHGVLEREPVRRGSRRRPRRLPRRGRLRPRSTAPRSSRRSSGRRTCSAKSPSARYGDAFRACADRLTDEGVDLAGYNLTQRVDDLEAARKALGYDRINLVSESAGTRYAMVYAWRYPKSVNRSVLIAVNPPGHFLWDAKTTDEQIARYSELLREGRRPAASAPTTSPRRCVRRTSPTAGWVLPIKEGNVAARLLLGAHGDDA